MISKIDIAILVFMTYHIIRGYSAGFSKSLFLSIRFIVSIILTRFIYINFSDEIITSVFYERYQLIMHELITKIISVFWYQALDLDPKVLAVSLFIVVSILINIVFYSIMKIVGYLFCAYIIKIMGIEIFIDIYIKYGKNECGIKVICNTQSLNSVFANT